MFHAILSSHVHLRHSSPKTLDFFLDVVLNLFTAVLISNYTSMEFVSLLTDTYTLTYVHMLHAHFTRGHMQSFSDTRKYKSHNISFTAENVYSFITYV